MADLCKKLPEFIQKFKKTKQTPNITKFAEATMPKGRGRKGSEPPRKRKKTSSTPEVQRVQNPAFLSSLTVEDSSQPAVNATSQCNVNSSNAANNVQPSSGYPSLSNAPTCCWPYPSWFSPPYQNFSPLPQAQSVASPYQNASPPPPSSPFQLCKLGGNINICFGCRNKYNKNASPPDDMYIKHQDWREYTTPDGQVQRRFGNVYYHFNPQCIWYRCTSLDEHLHFL